MTDSEESAVLKWGPGLIGTTVGLVLYGASIFQYLFYIFEFPNDKRLLRVVVLLVFVLDTINTITSISFYCRTLIFCRRQTTYACTLEMPWDLSACMGTGLFASFFVQSFYAYRVWIISNRNILLTVAVLVAALVQVAFGFALLGAARHTGDISTLFTSSYAPVNALGGVICDTIITASVFYYFRCLRKSLFRKENYFHQLNLIFVQMGLITSSSALTMAILYYQDQPSGQYLTAGPGFMLSKAYSNSMLAVLNARKLVHDHQRHARASSLELPTISSIH